jgi:hypothetical protein
MDLERGLDLIITTYLLIYVVIGMGEGGLLARMCYQRCSNLTYTVETKL